MLARNAIVIAIAAIACTPPPTPEPIASAPIASAPVASAPTPKPTLVPTPQPERPTLDIEFVPTPDNVVTAMLDAAQVGPDDVVYDLGCGDGRLVIAAAERFGARGVGFDLDPVRVAEARANVERAGLGDRVTIEQRNIFDVDLSPASVVTLYLLPSINVKLIPQLERLRPGARIVSHDFGMEGIDYDDVQELTAAHHRPPPELRTHYVYRWTTPLRRIASVP